MAYNAIAESYGAGTPLEEERFFSVMDDLYCLFDNGQIFKLTEAVGKCPSIEKYSHKTQADILRVVMRDQEKALSEPTADLFERVGKYRWRYRQGNYARTEHNQEA